MDHEVALRVLGPVRVRNGNGWQAPGTAQLRLLLGLMALQAGQVVPVADLIDAIWDDKPPRSARASLQSLVTRLRHQLAQVPGTALVHCGDGYRFEPGGDIVDAGRFRSLGRAARAADGPAAIELFGAALALWHGPVLADAAETARARVIRQGLDTEFMSVTQDRLALMLACGRLREVAAELPAALTRFPLDERLAGMLMVTLYRSGQRADALRVFRRIRRRLAAQLGVEPGPELQALNRRILSGDAILARPANGRPGAARNECGGQADGAAASPPRVVPRQLPAVPVPFVGRDHELAELDATISAAAEPDGAPVVWVIVGMAGVGKSTLATYWAQRAASSFPDGQIYLNLKGFSPAARPATPEQAARGILRVLGVPSAELPKTLDAQAALYRSMLAGKRVLIVLDNALDSKQVRALLPGSPGCAAVVTSRAELDTLVVSAGAQVLSLDVLSATESRALLAERLGTARVLAEPEAVTGLARSCGGLPLGLAVVAARAAARPGLPLSALSAELGGTARLDALETSDRDSSMREVLSWSYRQLSESAARMFRLLGLHPGPDVSVPAAASLAGTTELAARRMLAELTRAHMVSEHAPGRFACHDLLHAYAAEQARACEDTGERESATLRLIDHYLHTAAAASHRLYPSRDPLGLEPAHSGTVPERMRDRAQALGWLGAEHPVLLAIAHDAAAAGYDARTWKLAAVMADYLDREGHWHDLAALGRIALAAAERRGDRRGEAHAHWALGTASWRFGEYQTAQSDLRSAITSFRDSRAQGPRARCHVTLGKVLAGQGRYARARSETEQALSLYRDLGHQAGEATALGDLGWHFATLGDYPAAVACCRRALDLHRKFGNPLGEAHAWDHLGLARHMLGDDATAVACYRRALSLLEEVSDRPEHAGILTRLGDAYRAAGNQEMARATWQLALAILDELHDPGADEVRSRLGGPARRASGVLPAPAVGEPLAASAVSSGRGVAWMNGEDAVSGS